MARRSLLAPTRSLLSILAVATLSLPAKAQEKATFQVELLEVAALAFDRKGDTLAAVCVEHEEKQTKAILKRWTLTEGKDRLTPLGRLPRVRAVAVSPDLRLVALGCEDKTARVFDAETGRRLSALTGHESQVLALAFAPDGKTLAAGSFTDVRLWDSAAGEVRTNLKGHRHCVTALAFAPDGKTLASAEGYFTTRRPAEARLWDLAGGKERLTIRVAMKHIDCLAFSGDGKLLAAGSEDRTAKVWEAGTGRELHLLKGHKADVTAVAFAPGSKVLASADAGGTLRLWGVDQGKEVGALQGHTEAITALAFSPDGQVLATGGSDGKVRLWSLDKLLGRK
jgi:WD40 repeat protein